jgi:hypothetical protein
MGLLEAAQAADEFIPTALSHDTARPPFWAVFAFFTPRGREPHTLTGRERDSLRLEAGFIRPKVAGVSDRLVTI